jgi:hypothetical protein
VGLALAYSAHEPPQDAAGRCKELAAAPVGRCRRCLLKGCEAEFHWHHPLQRYCSPQCAQAARRWAQARANQRYRASEHGKERRKTQACRYRERCRTREHGPEDEAQPVPLAGGEGYGKADPEKNCCCDRPGCYERFARTARSPQQKFCSAACRAALRRVLVREARWRKRFEEGADRPQRLDTSRDGPD